MLLERLGGLASEKTDIEPAALLRSVVTHHSSALFFNNPNIIHICSV